MMSFSVGTTGDIGFNMQRMSSPDMEHCIVQLHMVSQYLEFFPCIY